MSSKFTDYTFKESTKAFIEQNGFVSPTPIQQKVIPLVCPFLGGANRKVFSIEHSCTGTK